MVTPSWRKPFGMALILLLILIWCLVVVSLPIGRLPSLVQALVYIVAGTIWIAPLKPLLRWMETGHWR